MFNPAFPTLDSPAARSNSLHFYTKPGAARSRSPFKRKEFTMDEPSGWLWLMLGVVGGVGLTTALIYGIVMWQHRRKDWATKQEQEEVTRENYRRGG